MWYIYFFLLLLIIVAETKMLRIGPGQGEEPSDVNSHEPARWLARSRPRARRDGPVLVQEAEWSDAGYEVTTTV